MAKIFLSFFNGIENKKSIPLFYEGFINGLQNHGNDVLFFPVPLFTLEGKASNKLIKSIKNFSPDLIILFNNFFYQYDFFSNFDCPVIVYDVDSVLFWKNKDILKNNEKCKFVTSGSDCVKLIKDTFNVSEKQICRIPFFSSVKAEKKEIKQNISFIGTFFIDTDLVKKFARLNPSAEEKEMFYKIETFLKGNPFINEKELIDSLGIFSEKILNILDTSAFIQHISSIKRIKVLSAIADLGLDLYGTSGWVDNLNFYPEITLSYCPQQVYSIQHNQDIYNSSKIGISVAHIQANSAFPWRITDIMASNACLVSDYHSDFDVYFPNIKIPIYSSPAEAREVCKDFLNNENKRLDIVTACQEVIDEKFRFENVLKILEQFSGVTLQSESEGTVFVLSQKNIIEEQLNGEDKVEIAQNKLSWKNKLRYKIWKKLDKKLRKKGIIP